MTANVWSAALTGIEAALIQVETRICPGVGYFIVGLAGDAVKESLFRVESAVMVAELTMPRQKLLVCLAPAGVRKEGAVFDLPIAVCVLVASGQIDTKLFESFLIVGELSLVGKLRPIRGALSMAIEAKKAGLKGIILPMENAEEAAMVEDFEVYGFANLLDVFQFLNGEHREPTKTNAIIQTHARSHGCRFHQKENRSCCALLLPLFRNFGLLIAVPNRSFSFLIR